MCGACSRPAEQDQWSQVLGSRRSRWEVARLVNGLLSGSGHPARVSCTAGAWVVRSGTGRDVVTDTISQLWQAVRSVRPLDPDGFQVAPGGPVSAVTAAVTSACEQSRGPVPC